MPVLKDSNLRAFPEARPRVRGEFRRVSLRRGACFALLRVRVLPAQKNLTNPGTVRSNRFSEHDHAD